nr:uncharacterized protein I203_02721 [Kwoniella mangroviensis CBS 8507]OCF68062.1 hypothetical protein I203_02721 [Kwoniella mangroviensis CBS 8507]
MAFNPIYTASGKRFPEEVMQHISHEVLSSSDSSLLKVLQTISKDMYKSVTPVLYRHIRLSRKSFDKLFKTLKSIPKIQVPTLIQVSSSSPNANLPSTSRIRQNLSYIQRISIDLTEFSIKEYQYDRMLGLLTFLREWMDQLLLPNASSICFRLSSRHNPPEKVLTIIRYLCKPKNVCVRWDQYDPEDEDIYEDDTYVDGEKEHVGIRPMPSTGSSDEKITFHNIDVNLLQNIGVSSKSTKLSLGKITPCQKVSQNLNGKEKESYYCRYHDRWPYDHEGKCGTFYETEPQRELLRRVMGRYSSSSEFSKVFVVQGASEHSMREDELRAFKKEYDRQLEEAVSGGRVKNRSLDKARQVKWYIGKDVADQPECEVCGEPI